MSRGVKFLLDSFSRVQEVSASPSSSPGEFEIDLFTPIKDVTRVDLIAAMVPKTMYAITQGVSDVLYVYSRTGTDNYLTGGIIELEEQAYTGETLAAEIQTKLRTLADTDYTSVLVSYDSLTNHFTIQSGQANVTILIPSKQTPELVPQTKDANSVDRNATPAISRILGLQASANESSVARTVYPVSGVPTVIRGVESLMNSVQEFPSMVDTSYPRYLYLEVEFGDSFDVPLLATTGTYTFVIPYADSNHLDIENFSAQSDFAQSVSLSTVNLKRIRVRYRWPEPSLAVVDFRGAESQLIFEAFSD